MGYFKADLSCGLRYRQVSVLWSGVLCIWVLGFVSQQHNRPAVMLLPTVAELQTGVINLDLACLSLLGHSRYIA